MTERHGGNIDEIIENYKLNASELSELIDFSVNLNPLGPPPAMIEQIYKAIEEIVRYPNPESRRLRTKLSEWLSIPADNFIVGNGSTELIYLVCYALKPRKALIPEPTFSEYRRSAQCAGSEISCLIAHESDDNFQVNLKELLKAVENVDVLFICNPNNPTGCILEKGNILKIAKSAPQTLIVIDEAYMDFCEEPERFSIIQEATRFDNILLIRSLTKLFAIPGLRLGYLVGCRNQIELLNRYKQPWNVNSLAQAAGEAVLANSDYIKKSRDLVKKERGFLFEQLAQFKQLKPFPAAANFILVKLKSSDPNFTSTDLKRELLNYGLLIRDGSSFIGLGSKFFRVAIKRREENLKLIGALRKIWEG